MEHVLQNEILEVLVILLATLCIVAVLSSN